jgi:hypothetical protein
MELAIAQEESIIIATDLCKEQGYSFLTDIEIST